ncbi:MAG TPA: FAD-dependent oxidoreductase [Peptococcaceae bacterium]|nr:FAD-dependent oxidoreductase [Peptococcaceae bacterium]
MFSNVLKPGKIGTLELKNRFIMPAMGSGHGDLDGRVTPKLIEYYKARAKGGFGLIIGEFACVSEEGKAVPGQLMITSDDYLPAFKQLTDSIHQAGGKIALQIHHAGRETNSAVTGRQPVAPSPIPCPINRELPRELTTAEIYELIEKFGEAALRAKKAGFDAVEIHGAHGYLVAQFLSPNTNKRVDEFGGDLSGRMKFAVELIKKIKEKCGQDYPLIFRISGEERVEGGMGLRETAAIAQGLAEAGADAIHVSTGVYASLVWTVAPYNVPQGYNLTAAETIKKAVNVPVIAVGRIVEPLMAENVVASGIADFVALGRASLADPDFPLKVKENRTQEISPCVGCLTRCQGVQGVRPDDHGVSCMINPFTGHENTMIIRKTEKPKKIVVVGGGPGGLEAAWVAAARGHQVILLEKSGQLGGQFLTASIPPGKQELARAIRYYIEMCKKYNVDIRLNVKADVPFLESLQPDAVILATGAVPKELNVPNQGIPVAQAVDILAGKVLPGQRNLVVGGGLVGLETAKHLLSQNRQATIVEMLESAGEDIHAHIKYFLFKSLADGNVDILTNTKVKEFKKDGALCQSPQGDLILTGYDMAILALGADSYNPLEHELRRKIKEVHVIGDAAKPRNAVVAIDEGALLGLEI